MTGKTRRFAVAGIVVATVAVLAYLLRPGWLPVETAVVERAPMQETVDAQGQTRARNRYVVAAPVAGRVARIALQEGDSVHPGMVVARIAPAPLDPRTRLEALARRGRAEDASRAASAAVAQARAALEQSRRSLARAQDLARKGLVATEERERAELAAISRERELESADFAAQSAVHAVEEARAALAGDQAGPVELHAPVRGVVVRVPERSERVVAAGEALLELADTRQVEVVADLLSADAVRVRAGSRVRVQGWGGGALNARLRLVEPSGFTKVSALGVEEQRVNTIADLDSVPPALGDRFRVELQIVVWEDSAVTQMPASAAFRRGEGWATYVVEGGRARLREVRIGHRTPLQVEVLGGPEPGTVVIRNPSDRVSEGTRVRAVTPSRASSPP